MKELIESKLNSNIDDNKNNSEPEEYSIIPIHKQSTKFSTLKNLKEVINNSERSSVESTYKPVRKYVSLIKPVYSN
jgi:hypothetical protein